MRFQFLGMSFKDVDIAIKTRVSGFQAPARDGRDNRQRYRPTNSENSRESMRPDPNFSTTLASSSRMSRRHKRTTRVSCDTWLRFGPALQIKTCPTRSSLRLWRRRASASSSPQSKTSGQPSRPSITRASQEWKLRETVPRELRRCFVAGIQIVAKRLYGRGRWQTPSGCPPFNHGQNGSQHHAEPRQLSWHFRVLCRGHGEKVPDTIISPVDQVNIPEVSDVI